jgi:hypothetical protein
MVQILRPRWQPKKLRWTTGGLDAEELIERKFGNAVFHIFISSARREAVHPHSPIPNESKCGDELFFFKKSPYPPPSNLSGSR